MSILFDLDVVVELNVEPVPGGQARARDILSPASGVSRRLPWTISFDASRRHSDGLGEAVLGDPSGIRNSSSRISPGVMGP